MIRPPATEAAAHAAVVQQGLLVSACDRDGACEIECGQVPPLDNCCRHKGLAALDALVSLVAATEQQRDEALAIVRGEQIETINESATRTLHATLDRAEAAERRAAETEAALREIISLDSANPPLDDSPASRIARAVLSAGGPEKTTT